MKTVFAFIGSPHRERSNTYILTKMMLDALVAKDSTIHYEILTPADVKISYCAGCWTCMMKGVCPLDEHDDMMKIRTKMQNADFIVFGSPVYTMNVSGQMKTFFDRLPAWLHTMRLAGKAGVTVVTTAGNGMQEVQDFLGQMMVSLGIKCVGQLGTYGYLPGMLINREAAKRDALAMADTIYPYVTGEVQVTSDKELEAVFGIMKEKITHPGGNVLAADLEFWRSHGMTDIDTFDALLKKIEIKTTGNPDSAPIP
jgi:multimeric flavodoxin WrbA